MLYHMFYSYPMHVCIHVWIHVIHIGYFSPVCNPCRYIHVTSRDISYRIYLSSSLVRNPVPFQTAVDTAGLFPWRSSKDHGIFHDRYHLMVTTEQQRVCEALAGEAFARTGPGGLLAMCRHRCKLKMYSSHTLLSLDFPGCQKWLGVSESVDARVFELLYTAAKTTAVI